ncbi:LacI family DNA-binding transcriptional regulator [Pelagibius sp. Alg239-R121]|uniref:LacI family DNA-binding transcriptional regulator n=1 Tax=Pelagibius sp. Alg239-R121 TaxID=2993448 RepID=UPI0024A78A84|nr:LacI family DNA-binding transcriptional regulator [Pelagibius sp. Alg239-R121]
MSASVTLKDVAQRAGVSSATVSRVINSRGLISAPTAEKVQAAIAELGFRPNAIGRNLKTSRTRTFGVLLPSLSNPIFGEVLEGVQTAALAAGYSIAITCSNYREQEEKHAIDTLLANRVDGLILTVADADNSAQLDVLDAHGIPYVLLFNQPVKTSRSAVNVDNRAAGRLVAEEFIQFGHTRVGMIAGRFEASDRSRLRFQGLCDGIADAGLEAPALVEVDFVEGRVARAVRNLLNRTDAPTALFCSTDMLALSVIDVLRSLGVGVPEQISIAGFDGISFGQLSHPRLATVVQPSHAMGQAAVQHLLGRMAGSTAPKLQVLPAGYRPGSSIGPARV